MRATFRPIDVWPGEKTPASQRKSKWTFKGSYSSTLELLEREMAMLGASDFVIQLEMSDRDIRLDGMPRQNATPAGPAVIVAFDSKHGALKYATDVFETWHCNLRAIALGLEALRKVERYGVLKRGEQYRGFTAIGSGTPMPAAKMTVDEAAQFLAKHGAPHLLEHHVWMVLAERGHETERKNAFRVAARRLHPDAGGATADYQKLQEGKRILDEAES